MTTRACLCGCGTLIPAVDGKGRPRWFLQGHQRYNLKLCACNCGTLIPLKNSRGERRYFAPGHYDKKARVASRLGKPALSGTAWAMSKSLKNAQAGWYHGSCALLNTTENSQQRGHGQPRQWCGVEWNGRKRNDRGGCVA